MNTDYRDLLIELLLDKMHTENIKKTNIVTASATITPLKKREFKQQHKWSMDDYEFVASSYKAGWTPADIAKTMGLRKAQVNMAIFRMKNDENAPKLLQENTK